MSSLLTLFIENIFPIVAVASVGFVLQRQFRIDPKPLSVAIFNALTPALIFQLTMQNTIAGGDSLKMVVLVLSVVGTLTALSYLVARWLRLPPVTTGGLFLTVAFMNAGNYGLSLNQFALGQDGLLWASIFFLANVMIMNSLGVVLASSGKTRLVAALRGLLRVPALYAFAAALIFRFTGIAAPQALIKPVDLLADATIPAMLLVLGMQIGRAGKPKKLGLVGLASVLRLIVSPALAWVYSLGLGLPLIASQAGILEAAMPSPVLAIIISLEYDTDPEFVSSVVLVSTILSPISLTILLSLLGL